MTKQPDKAVYYSANLDGKTFDILKQNSDGTVDIGTGGTIVAKSCPVFQYAKEGHCTLGEDPVSAPPKPPARREATEPEILREMQTNLKACNDWWQAKMLVEHRLQAEANKAAKLAVAG